MSDNWVATVAPAPSGRDRKTLHTWNGEPMPWPAVVLLELHDNGSMAFRYAADGSFAGDTWHESVDSAQAALKSEYGELLSAWRPVPDDEPDATAFVLRIARETSTT